MAQLEVPRRLAGQLRSYGALVSGTPGYLLRPVPVERISTDPIAGEPCVRTTGIRARDVAFELGAQGLSDLEVLERHPELEPSDLEAVRAYERAPIELDAAIDRAMAPAPDQTDVLTAYLFLPRIRLSYHKHAHMGVPMKVRSSFEAAFTDAELCPGRWLAAIGQLGLLDQIGSALDRTDRSADGPTSVERSLELFSDLPAPDRATLYALRCALAHDFSLVNKPDRGSPTRKALLTHAFVLHADGEAPLVEYPAEPWRGDLEVVESTQVHLGRLTNLVHEVRRNIFSCFHSSTLRLRLDESETRRRYIFTHGATNDEWESQASQDELARWPSPT